MLKKTLFAAIGVLIFASPFFASAATQCIQLTRTLSQGSAGADVSALQTFLVSQNLLSSDLVTGYFGSHTQAAVQQFQCAQSITCSGSPTTTGWGVVGPHTRAAIQSLSCGTTQNPVSCNLSVDNAVVYPGESATVSWTSTNAAGGFITPTIGTVGPSGSKLLSNLQQTTTFTGTFTGTGNNSASCNTTVTVIGGTTPPAGSLSATPISGNAPLTVFFGGSIPANAYTLNFGDGSTPAHGACTGGCATLPVNATHTYSSAGTYTATLMNASGTIVGTATITVTSSTLPMCPVILVECVAGDHEQQSTGTDQNGCPLPPTCVPNTTGSLSATPTSGAAPLSVTFTGSAPPNTYTLNFGDGSTPATGACTGIGGCTSIPVNATHTYAAAGTYAATLINSSGTNVGAVTIAVTGTTAQTPTINSFTASPASITQGQSSALSWSTTGATSMSISGIGTVTGTSVTVTPSQTTTYTLTATNSAGSVTAQATVTVASGGGVSLTASPASGSPPLTVNFSYSNAQPGTYVQFGEGSSNVQICGFGSASNCSGTISHTYSTSGTYTATLSYCPGQGCGNIVAQTTITVTGAAGNYSLTASPSSGSSPLAVSFTANVTPTNNSFNWVATFGDSTSPQAAVALGPCASLTSCTFTFSHTYAAPGTYTATVAASGPGSVPSETTTVTVTSGGGAMSAVTCGSDRSAVRSNNVFGYSPSSGSAPLVVTFEQPMDTPFAYDGIDFGDGTPRLTVSAFLAASCSATGSNYIWTWTHTYASPGTYTANYTANGQFPYPADAATITATNGPMASGADKKANLANVLTALEAILKEIQAQLGQ